MALVDELTVAIGLLVELFEAAQQDSSEVLKLSKQECWVINVVGQNQPLIMRELAEYAKLSVTNTTGIVDKLVTKGYLRRERSDSDRRIVTIRLTAEGQAMYALEVENYRKVSQAILDRLDGQEQQEMARMLRKATAHLNRTPD